nr:synaptobrevin, longin-like domain protein [Tanacetum cinerariifolium]GEX46819.1 synaptobrevin, longin-like domain protein [Tanacetum cinerariifolium]
MAFISSAKNSSGNGEVNTASIPTANTQVSPASANVAAASISLDTAYTCIASQSSSSQIKYEDINQIDEDDIKEMDIKWNMALLSMRADRYWKKTGKKIPFKDWSYMDNEEEDHALVADQEALTEFALMAKSSFDTENGDSTSSILSKPEIKFVKAANSPTVIKTSKDETVRKPSVKYAEMYRKLQKVLILAFCNYHNMIAILEKYEHNVDFHPIVDFVEASYIRYALTINPTVYVSHIRQFWSTARIETMDEGTKILTTVDGKPRTIFESSISRNLKLNDEAEISSLPDAELFENLTLMGYNISPNQKFSFQKGQFSHQWKYLIHTIMQCLSPKSTSFNEFSSNITTALVCLATNRVYNFSKMIFDGMVRNVNNKVSKILMYPSDSTPRVTSLAADEGNMQQKLNELTDLCTRLQRQQTEMASKIATHDLEIASLKARIKMLEDKDRGGDEPFEEDATIKGRSLETGEEAGIEKSTNKGSNDIEEMVNVLTSLDAASILTSGVQVSIPPAAEVATEYEQFAADLDIRERIELINDLVKYQDNYAKVLKSAFDSGNLIADGASSLREDCWE